MTRTIEGPGIKLPPQILDDLTRREFLIGAGLVALAPACGNDEESDGDGSSSGQTRTVEHALGTTEVPKDPQRVVSLDPTTTETLLALGITPVGSVTYVDSPISEALRDRAEDEIEELGSTTEPNMEKIAALEPDLIVGAIFPTEEIQDETSRIAPTVAAPYGDEEWKEHVRIIARAVGLDGVAEEELAEYGRRVEKLSESLGGETNGTEVSVVRVDEAAGEGVTAYVKSSFAGSVLEDVGFSRPPSQDIVQGTWNVDISLEQLEKVDGDVMFAFTGVGGEEAEEVFDELRRDPLWTRLEVVQEGRVYEVGDYWGGAGSLIAADLILDDIEEHLLEGGSN